LKTHLENQGMSNYISYLNNLTESVFLTKKIEFARAVTAWRYYSCVLQLLYLSIECEKKQMLMTPESEEEAILRRQEIADLTKKKLEMESTFEQQ
jgi:hypothetical protein